MSTVAKGAVGAAAAAKSAPNFPLAAFHLSQRVQLDSENGNKGTIRYIGQLYGQPPHVTYVGVEWDQPVGKNDGSLPSGHRYFQCPLLHGSFLHHQRLLPSQSLFDAIIDKYSFDIDPLSHSALSLRGRNGARHFAVPVEFAGLESLQQTSASELRLKSMTQASVTQLQIAHVHTPTIEAQSLAALTSSIIDLDLTDNLLSEWQEVEVIVKALRNLHILKLSKNHLLSLSSATATVNYSHFNQLRVLVLNGVNSDVWTSVIQIAANNGFQALNELYLAENKIQQLLIPRCTSTDGGGRGGEECKSQVVESLSSNELVAWFPSLTLIDLSYNAISDWSQVQLLSSLPALRKLVLSNNALTEVRYQPQSFRSLLSLSLSENTLSSLSVFDTLAHFPALVDLKIQRNPSLDSQCHHNLSTLRFHAISHIPALQSLNSSTIPRRERIDADKFYLSFALRASQNRDSLCRELSIGEMFPRYEMLLAKYGTDIESGATASTSSTTTANSGATITTGQTESISIASTTVTVTLEWYPSGATTATSSSSSSQSKRLLLSMKVSALRVLMEKLGKVSVGDRSQWVMKVSEAGDGKDWQSMDDSMKVLSFYDVRQGSKIALVKS